MKKLALLFSAIICMSGIANALSLDIEVGDRGYYNHGPGYWSGRAYYVWVPGHWCGYRRDHSHPYGHRVWCHGHYAVR